MAGVIRHFTNMFFTTVNENNGDDRALGPLLVSQQAYEALTPTQKVYKTALLTLTCMGTLAAFYVTFGVLTSPFRGLTFGWGENGKGLLGGAALGAIQGAVMGVVMSPEFSRRTGLFQENQPAAQAAIFAAIQAVDWVAFANVAPGG